MTNQDGRSLVQVAHEALAHDQFPGAEWEHADPATLGWSIEGLKTADDYEKHIGFTSVMVIQHGVVVDEWGNTHSNTPIYSARKSFMSALYGIAQARGQINVDATLEQLGIDDNAPSLTPAEKQTRLIYMLEARSGVYHDAAYEPATMVARRPPRGSHAPNTFWYYNNWDFNTLGSIYEKEIGVSVFKAVQTELAAPIGMQDYSTLNGRDVGDSSSRYPAYTMQISARDMGRFGLLYLNRGSWNGKQIIPADWVAKSQIPYSDTGRGGYGLLWWTNQEPDGHVMHNMPASYWAEGNFGQFIIVTPALDMVVVLRFDTLRKGHKQDGKIKPGSAMEALWLVESASGATHIGTEPIVARERKKEKEETGP